MNIPLRRFRKSPVRERRVILEEAAVKAGAELNGDFHFSGKDEGLLDLADAMVEQAVGYMGVPLGLAGPFLIDGQKVMVPMATEEPSVVAAASFAGHLLSRHGGILTEASEPVMTAQLFVEKTGNRQRAETALVNAENDIRKQLAPLLASMEERGGGWREMDLRWLEESETLVVNLKIDVRDAMGANLLNSAAEEVRPFIEEITGGHVLMAILSNRSLERTAKAHFSLPVEELGRNGFDGAETAERIVRAALVAKEDPNRAVTHNKGIMNGISALALVTGNDTRAIEAAAHSYAGRLGPYHGISDFRIEKDMILGSLELPLPFASTGGAVGFHPVSRWAMDQLGNPNARQLSRIAAAVGLAQNLSALRALVSEGIQKGHMGLHARRLAYNAGARGDDLSTYAAFIREEGIRSRKDAVDRYMRWKDNLK